MLMINNELVKHLCSASLLTFAIANHHLYEGEDDTVHTYCVENMCSSTGILLAYEATW
jgi:hypothetical protein